MNPLSNCDLSSVSLQSANRDELPRETLQALDDWMATRFKSYIWLSSEREGDVDFVIAWKGGEMIGRSAVVTREVLLDGQPLAIMG
jgi:hypothetical protein